VATWTEIEIGTTPAHAVDDAEQLLARIEYRVGLLREKPTTHMSTSGARIHIEHIVRDAQRVQELTS